MQSSIINGQPCSNCGKLFPEEKIDLHQAYCRRNIKKCPTCFQLYDINDQEGHDKQFHSKKDCRYCGVSLPEKEWDAHQPSCKRRPLKCQFCENDIPYEEVIKHQNVCGSRTTKCETCRQYVAMREMQEHQKNCVVRLSPVRNQQPRTLSRDELRQNVRDLPQQLNRMRSDEERRYQGNRIESIGRNEVPNFEVPLRRNQRNDRNSNQRVNVISNEKQRNSAKKPVVNFHMNVKPSHIIEPEKVRQMVDPVPISIRLAMGNLNRKMPLQNKN